MRDLVRERAWGEIALRVVFCALLLASGVLLLGESTFAYRMRDDAAVAGLPGNAVAAFGLAAVVALAPLASGRRFLRAYLAGAFVVTGLGAYWWTTIPWDELLTETNFTRDGPASLLEHLVVALPSLLAAAFVALSAPSRMRADLLARGVSRDEARAAAATAFLHGAAALATACAAGAGVAWLAARGWPEVGGFDALRGGAALLAAVVLVGAAMAAYGRRIRGAEAGLTRPSGPGGDRGVLARIRARRSPS